jgi:hypothetical protein
MLHSVFVGQADVIDTHAVGRGLGDLADHALHLCIVGVKRSNVVTQNALRARDLSAIWRAGVKIEFRIVGLRYQGIDTGKRQTKGGQNNGQFCFH